MIKFFRKIRQNLLNEGKTAKYFKYAIGEIVLVVIGILIALQINNWKENKLERKQEKAILNQLNSEFKSNLDQLDEKIKSKTELMKSVLKLLNYIDNPKLRIKDSIDYHLARTIPYSTFDPIVNDLASSGNLRLIRNDSLKQMLSFWTSEIKDVQEDEGSWKYYRNETFVPFLVQHYQLRTVRNKAFKTNFLDRYLITENNNDDITKSEDIGITKHPEDFYAMLNHPDFEDHLIRAYTVNKFAKEQCMILRKRIVEILETLNKEIEQ